MSLTYSPFPEEDWENKELEDVEEVDIPEEEQLRRSDVETKTTDLKENVVVNLFEAISVPKAPPEFKGPPVPEMPAVLSTVMPSLAKSYKELLVKEDTEIEQMFAFRKWISSVVNIAPIHLFTDLGSQFTPEAVIYVGKLLTRKLWYNLNYDTATEIILDSIMGVTDEFLYVFG